MSQDFITMHIELEHERPFESLMSAFGDIIKFINHTDYYFFHHPWEFHLFSLNGDGWEKINYDPERFRFLIYSVLTPHSYSYTYGTVSQRRANGEYRIVFDMFGPFSSSELNREVWDTVPLKVVGAFTI